MTPVIKVLLTAPQIAQAATGESYVGFKWAEALSERVDLTVLSFQHPKHPPLGEQLPLATVHSWPQPKAFLNASPFRTMLKPEYLAFFRQVRGFMARHAEEFDIAHQFLPMAMRYPTPLRGHGVPYVMGPLGGGLDSPPGFVNETSSAQWFTKLRDLDKYRRRFDPWLRATYSKADLVLGVAPYIRDNLAAIQLQRYENLLELGIDELAPRKPVRDTADIHLLHVGRAVRTKGLREVINALALLRDRPGIRLTSAGGGEEIEICQREAEALGVADRVTFLGRVSRAKVEELYASADAFVFPSFREPTGGVLYEAMRWGLPIIAARYGGPASIVNDACGVMVDAIDPTQMARDVAAAVVRLADDRSLRQRLGDGAREQVAGELWHIKADRLVALYREVLADAKRPSLRLRA